MKKLLLFIIVVAVMSSQAYAQDWCTDCNLSDGLIHYYSFDTDEINSSHIFDEVGSIDGLIRGNPTNTTGIVGNAFDFDGSGDFIDFLDNSTIPLRNGTIAHWLTKQGTANFRVASYTSSGNGTSLFNGWGHNPADQMETNTGALSGNWSATYQRGDGTSNTVSGDAFVQNVYEFIVFTYDETGNISIYQNGTLKDTLDVSAESFDDTIEAINGYIGRLGQSPTLRNWAGNVDEFGIWNRTLNANEILSLHNGTEGGFGFGCNPVRFPNCNQSFWWGNDPLTKSLSAYYSFDTDEINSSHVQDSIGTADGEINSDPQNITGLIGNAFDFDGTDDYLEFAEHIIPLGGGTIAHWLYFTGGVTEHEIGLYTSDGTGAIYNGYGDGAQTMLEFHTGYSPNEWKGIIQRGTSTSIAETDTNVTNSDSWTFIVLTYNESTDMTIYINGTEIDVIDLSGLTFGAQVSTNTFFGRHGQSGASARNWDGRVDEMGLWTRVLTAQEVLALHNGTEGGFGFGCNPVRFPLCNGTISTPNVTDLLPLDDTDFARFDVVDIRANVTDDTVNTISSVTSNITLPNGTINAITMLLDSGDEYQGNFTNTFLLGTYQFKILATNEIDRVNDSETGFFDVVEAVTIPEARGFWEIALISSLLLISMLCIVIARRFNSE